MVLDLPAGYQPSALFSGFQNDELGVSYVILEVPAKAYEELAAGFASAELAKRGLTDAAKGTLPRSDDYIYMRARQKSPAGTYAKFFVLLRTHDQTVLISTNVPAAAINSGTVSVDDVERVLATARTVDVTAVKTLYRLGYLGPFREAGSFIGTSRLYTLDGRMEPDPRTPLARPCWSRLRSTSVPSMTTRLWPAGWCCRCPATRICNPARFAGFPSRGCPQSR